MRVAPVFAPPFLFPMAGFAAPAASAVGPLLELERGTIAASIFAAPRVFQVGTPSGIAVDMGCVYRATVHPDGRTHLAVDAGLVAFETGERRIVVPAGASGWADPEQGPGTPVWDGASAAWRDGVARLDAGESGPELLAELLASEGGERTLVLWHLVSHPNAELRAPAFDALAELAPPPGGVGREACLAGERQALERWRAALDWSW